MRRAAALALLLLGACDGAPTAAEDAEFRGFLSFGPEQSEFRPCNLPQVVAWAAGRPSPAWDQVDRFLAREYPDADGWIVPPGPVYVEFNGASDPEATPGRLTGYGHLGAYRFQVRLAEVVRIRRPEDAPSSCPSPHD